MEGLSNCLAASCHRIATAGAYVTSGGKMGGKLSTNLGALYCANISSQERDDIALSLGIVRA